MRVRAHFNGVFGNFLCLSHSAVCKDESGAEVVLRGGMLLTPFDEDTDKNGERDDLIATGTVLPSPDSVRSIDAMAANGRPVAGDANRTAS